MGKLAVALLVALAALTACFVYGNPPAFAAAYDVSTTTQPTPSKIIYGADRYETAILVSQEAYPNGSQAVVIARGDAFPDALCAAPLAHHYGGPLLLTPSNALTVSVLAELQRLTPSHVFLVGIGEPGGTMYKQVSSVVGAENVTTIIGTDRYQTAALVAQQLQSATGSPDKVVLAPGDSFPDALAASPLAAANDWPILLTPQNASLPSVTKQAIADLEATSVVEVGTRAATGVADTTRLVGSDRYQTCAMIATYALTQGAAADHVAFVKGDNYPDGLTSGPYLAQDDGLLLLTSEGNLPATIDEFLVAQSDQIQTADAIGLSGMPEGSWNSLWAAGRWHHHPTTSTTAAPSTTTTSQASTTTTVAQSTTSTASRQPTTSTTIRQSSTTTTTVRPTTTTVIAGQPTTSTTARPSTSSTIPPASSFDLQSAINACPAGGTVTVPAGTYACNSTINLKSGVTIQGAGASSTILTMPASSGVKELMIGAGISNVAIRDIGFQFASAGAMIIPLHIWNYSSVTLERIRVANAYYALKADTKGSNLTVRDLTVTGTAQPIYISNLTGGLFENLNLQALTTATSGFFSPHALYIERNNHSLQFNSIQLAGGIGFTLQLYTDAGWSSPSSGISFNGLSLAGTYGIVVGSGYEDIGFSNVTASASSSGESLFTLYDPHTVTISAFQASGGASLLTSRGGSTTCRDISFHGGTYSGSRLLASDSASIQNLVIDLGGTMP